MTCRHQLDDGAYILGALVPAERAEFERHLATCAPCRESIAQLAVLPGLLGRLGADTVGPTVTAPATLLPRLLTAARATRSAQRRRQILATVAAAVTVAVAAAVGLAVTLPDRSGPTAAIELAYSTMTSVGGFDQVAAEIRIQAQSNGTLVAVRCLYRSDGDRAWPIWLVVYPRSGGELAEPIGSWVAIPGEQIQVTAVTHYPPTQIDRIELQGDNNTTIAWWSPRPA